MRILTLDIETRPALAYIWRMFDENIPLARLEEAGETICFAAKWVDEKQVIFASEFHDGRAEMAQIARDLMDEADAIVHYNGTRFDMKHLRREIILHGIAPPSKHRDIDLLSVVRTQFKFDSNKLDHVASELGLGSKVKHDGFELWRQCMAGDPKAWKRMKRYCVGDVKLTEALFKVLQAWIPHLPNAALYDGGDHVCGNPLCGSTDLMRRGFAYTPTRKYQKWQCKSCGRYMRSKFAETDQTSLRNVA